VTTLRTHLHDRRTAELMRHSDSIEEKRWRARVSLNRKEILRLAGKPVAARTEESRPAELPMMMRKQAS
jgi:hypothetical protein